MSIYIYIQVPKRIGPCWTNRGMTRVAVGNSATLAKPHMSRCITTSSLNLVLVKHITHVLLLSSFGVHHAFKLYFHGHSFPQVQSLPTFTCLVTSNSYI